MAKKQTKSASQRSADQENPTSNVPPRNAVTDINRQQATSNRPISRAVHSQRVKQVDHNGVILLAGGNPQISKGDGDAPVQAYISAMPGWKSGLGKQLDALIVECIPDVRKAVRWNSPFYGVEGKGWFVSFHVLTRYVKVTFFNGISLDPPPPGGTPRSGEARWIDLYEDDKLDIEQMSSWIRQSAQLPGWGG